MLPRKPLKYEPAGRNCDNTVEACRSSLRHAEPVISPAPFHNAPTYLTNSSTFNAVIRPIEPPSKHQSRLLGLSRQPHSHLHFSSLHLISCLILTRLFIPVLGHCSRNHELSPCHSTLHCATACVVKIKMCRSCGGNFFLYFLSYS